MEGVELKKYKVQWALARPDDFLYAEGYDIESGETLTFYGCPGSAYYISYQPGHWKDVMGIQDES